MATRYIAKLADLDHLQGLANHPSAAGFVYNTADDKVYVNGDGTLRPLLTDHSNGNIWFVDPQNGSDSNTGQSWGQAFASFSTGVDGVLGHGDTVFFTGVTRENWDAPYFNDVSIIGVANTPRQATDSGVHNGGGATWLSLSTPAAAPLLTINKQAWHVENIFFNNADTTNNSSCIKLLRDQETPEADASHTAIVDCKFTGEEHGILGSGGVQRITIAGCTFESFDSAGDTAITNVTGAGAATPVEWSILGNYFENNVNHISCGATGALISSRIIGNTFSWKRGGGVTTTLQVDLGTVAVDNIVMDNYFQIAEADTGTATMFLPQDNNNAWLNWYADGIVARVPNTAA